MEKKRQYIRQVVAFGNYFKDFKKTLSRNTLSKIYQTFVYIMILEQVPEKYLKAITTVKGLYEVRVEESGNIYRIFCCMDEGNLVILFNGFHKKTQKTPPGEVERSQANSERIFFRQKDERRDKQ